MPDCTPNSGNISQKDDSLEIDPVAETSGKSDPWDYLDINSSQFVPKLLLFALQKKQNSSFRNEVMSILSEYFAIESELKYLKGAFSREGVRLLDCMFKSEESHVVVDAFRLLLILFRTHKDAFLLKLKTSLVFYDVLKLLWNKNYFGDVCNLLKVFIQLGSRQEVVEVFELFEVLETICASAKIKVERDHTRVTCFVFISNQHKFQIYLYYICCRDFKSWRFWKCSVQK